MDPPNANLEQRHTERSFFNLNGKGRTKANGLLDFGSCRFRRGLVKQNDDAIVVSLIEDIRSRQDALAGATTFLLVDAYAHCVDFRLLPNNRHLLDAINKHVVLELQRLERCGEAEGRQAPEDGAEHDL